MEGFKSSGNENGGKVFSGQSASVSVMKKGVHGSEAGKFITTMRQAQLYGKKAGESTQEPNSGDTDGTAS